MSVQDVKLATIVVDADVQMRASGLDESVVAAYAEALDDLPPVVVFIDAEARKAWLADGFHRLAAHVRAGKTTIKAECRRGTRRDAILHSVASNAEHGLRRTHADKRRAVETLLADPEWASWSDRVIADAAKVDHKTVARYRAEFHDVGNSPDRETRKTADGLEYTAPAREDTNDFAGDLATAIDEVEQAQTRPHVAQNAGDNEWYTPPEILNAARRVLGQIDCDPASSDVAQARVQAAAYYTAEQDGLDTNNPWNGRVWMNPPYAQPFISRFVERLVDEVAAGNVSEAIALTNNGTETQWGQGLLRAANAVCFPGGRIRFLDPDGNPGAPLQGQMIAYLGQNPDVFRREFEEFGAVLVEGEGEPTHETIPLSEIPREHLESALELLEGHTGKNDKRRGKKKAPPRPFRSDRSRSGGRCRRA